MSNNDGPWRYAHCLSDSEDGRFKQGFTYILPTGFYPGDAPLHPYCTFLARTPAFRCGMKVEVDEPGDVPREIYTITQMQGGYLRFQEKEGDYRQGSFQSVLLPWPEEAFAYCFSSQPDDRFQQGYTYRVPAGLTPTPRELKQLRLTKDLNTFFEGMRVRYAKLILTVSRVDDTAIGLQETGALVLRSHCEPVVRPWPEDLEELGEPAYWIAKEDPTGLYEEGAIYQQNTKHPPTDPSVIKIENIGCVHRSHFTKLEHLPPFTPGMEVRLRYDIDVAEHGELPPHESYVIDKVFTPFGRSPRATFKGLEGVWGLSFFIPRWAPGYQKVTESKSVAVREAIHSQYILYSKIISDPEASPTVDETTADVLRLLYPAGMTLAEMGDLPAVMRKIQELLDVVSGAEEEEA